MKNPAVCFLLLLLPFSACSRQHEAGGEERAGRSGDREEAAAADTSAVRVTGENRRFLDLQVAAVHPQRIVDALETPAILRPHPDARATVKAPTQGWIRALPVLPGSRVKKGDPVAVIENPNNLGRRLVVEAPIDGMVTTRPAGLSEWVESGEVLLDMADYRRLQGVAEIYPDDLARVKIGQPISILQDGRTASGTIAYLSPMADAQTGAVEARADIANPDESLRADAPLTARIIVGEREALVVPRGALLREEDHFIVFVQEGEQFEKRPVKTGVRDGERVEIIDGIEEGENVVTRGAYPLKNIAFSGAPPEED